MATKLTIEQVAREEGYQDETDLLEAVALDSVVPACCSDGCQVEPDGHCEHGFPSVLLEAGLI